MFTYTGFEPTSGNFILSVVLKCFGVLEVILVNISFGWIAPLFLWFYHCSPSSVCEFHHLVLQQWFLISLPNNWKQKVKHNSKTLHYKVWYDDQQHMALLWIPKSTMKDWQTAVWCISLCVIYASKHVG